MSIIDIFENNKQIILKLICNEIMKRDIYCDVECLKKLIINNEIKYYLIRLMFNNKCILINEETYELGIIDIDMFIKPNNKFYFYSKELKFERGFTYFSRDINPLTFELIDKLIKLEEQKDKKINQCIVICKSLINNKFKRPFNLTEDIMNCY